MMSESDISVSTGSPLSTSPTQSQQQNISSADQREVLCVFFSHIRSETLPKSWNSQTPLSDWWGVDTDAAGNVIRICAESKPWMRQFEGQLSHRVMAKLGTLLPELLELDLRGHRLGGSIARLVQNLPPKIRSVRLSYNNFIGSVAVDQLPESLVVLELIDLQLSGVYDNSKIPAQVTFNISGNKNAIVLGAQEVEVKSSEVSTLVGVGCFLFTPALIIIIVLAATGFGLEADGTPPVCERVLNASCVDFWDACSVSTQVTALPPQEPLCPNPSKCCVAGTHNLFIERARRGDTNNTFVYSDENHTLRHFSYFISPPIDFVTEHTGRALGSSNGTLLNPALAKLCGKIGGKIVPPGAIIMLFGAVLGALSSVLLNLIASTACYMRVSAATGACLARVFRCACPARCLMFWCEEDATEASHQKVGNLLLEEEDDDGWAVVDYGTGNSSPTEQLPPSAINDENEHHHHQCHNQQGDANDDDDESLATYGPGPSTLSHASSPSRSRAGTRSSGVMFFGASRRRRFLEQQLLTRHVSFVRRCFRPSGMLGFKCAVMLLVAWADAIMLALEGSPDAVQLSERWETYTSVLVNGSAMKGAIDALCLVFVSAFYDRLRRYDMVLVPESAAHDLDDAAVKEQQQQQGQSAAEKGGSAFLACLQLLRHFIAWAGWCTVLVLGTVPVSLPLILAKREPFESSPTTLRRYLIFFSIIMLPTFVTHILPGLILYFPLVMSASLLVCVVTFAGVLLTWARIRILTRCGRDMRNPANHWREDSLADNVFHFLRMGAFAVLATMVSLYLCSMPSNMSALLFSHGAGTYLHGAGWARTIYDEVATRTQACYFLQTYETALHSFETFLRLF